VKLWRRGANVFFHFKVLEDGGELVVEGPEGGDAKGAAGDDVGEEGDESLRELVEQLVHIEELHGVDYLACDGGDLITLRRRRCRTHS
jgi:hypothetical protein